MSGAISPFKFKLSYPSHSGEVDLYPDQLIIHEVSRQQKIPLNYLRHVNWTGATMKEYGSLELLWTPTLIQPPFNYFIFFNHAQAHNMYELCAKLAKFCSTNLNQPNDIL